MTSEIWVIEYRMGDGPWLLSNDYPRVYSLELVAKADADRASKHSPDCEYRTRRFIQAESDPDCEFADAHARHADWVIRGMPPERK